MRLKSVTVGNFKNVAETKLDLNTITAIVSANNYGKSNLLEALNFGFSFIKASTAIRFNMTHWKPGIPLTFALAEKDFIFSVEFEAPDLGKYRFVRYSYRFKWANDKDSDIMITDEAIEARETESVRYTSYLRRNKSLYRASKAATGFRRLALTNDSLAVDVLYSLADDDISKICAKIKSLSKRMCNTLDLGYSFWMNPIDFGPTSDIMFNDNDIPRALYYLKKTFPEKFHLFLEMVYDLFPEFSDIKLQVYGLKDMEQPEIHVIEHNREKKDSPAIDIPYRLKDEMYQLVIKSSSLNQPISMEYMSTGTKRIIWLLANAVYGGCTDINLIGVDEIETSIHPKMINNLLESISSVLGDTSMIVTSHSPYLIQYLKPKAIYIGVPNDEGIARFKKIQQTKIKTLINTSRSLGLSMGEYLFELMSGDDDSTLILSSYLED